MECIPAVAPLVVDAIAAPRPMLLLVKRYFDTLIGLSARRSRKAS